MSVRRLSGLIKSASVACLAAALIIGGSAVIAQEKENEGGKYLTPEGEPTYNVKEDGTVDWYTFSGFRRYHSECHVCHGPDGLGSSYAPNLVESLKTMTYEDFQTIVINGRQNGTSVMPAFGTNKNVFCYLDDIYVYLKARADDKVGRGRPAKKEAFPPAAKEYENQCMG